MLSREVVLNIVFDLAGVVVRYDQAALIAEVFPEPTMHATVRADIIAVFAHAVLMHLREPVRALAEVRRVLRPGGIAGVRDSDWGGRIHAPATPLLEQWYALTVRIRQRNSGDPFMGRHHRRLLARGRVCACGGERVCVECGNTGGNAAMCQLP
jgi:SAM-dependent methyltransferase